MTKRLKLMMMIGRKREGGREDAPLGSELGDCRCNQSLFRVMARVMGSRCK